jgi:hypothetical protein
MGRLVHRCLSGACGCRRRRLRRRSLLEEKQLLNWRRDPGYEQRKMQHEQRMKQLENETEQLRQENRRLAALQSRMDALLRTE